MRCAKCQKSLPQTNSHSGTLLSLSAGFLMVGGFSYLFSFLKPGLTLAAGAVAACAFTAACRNSIRIYSANATTLDAGGVQCPHCTHVNYWSL